MPISRQYRAGQTVEDYCRQCKEDRIHTIIVVDGQDQPLRVTCDYCRSEHNYRGGPRSAPPTAPHKGAPYETTRTNSPAPRTPSAPDNAAPYETTTHITTPDRRAPLYGAANETTSSEHDMPNDFETVIRRIIREETGLTSVAPAEKWRGGQLVLRPGKPGVQEKAWPIETFFNKVVMLRNRLRTLEQQVNASELPDDQKLKLQAYITGCYGSLTSFNVLFADDEDRFVGSGD
jgi:hypothetical protein